MLIDFQKAKEDKELKNMSEKDKSLYLGTKFICLSSNDRLLALNKKWKTDVLLQTLVAIWLDAVLWYYINDPNMGKTFKIIFISLMVFIGLTPLMVAIYKLHERKTLLKERERI